MPKKQKKQVLIDVQPMLETVSIVEWVVWDLGADAMDKQIVTLAGGLRNMLERISITHVLIEQQGRFSIPERIISMAIVGIVKALRPHIHVEIVSASKKLSSFGIQETSSYVDRKEKAVQLVQQLTIGRFDAATWSEWMEKEHSTAHTTWFKTANDLADAFLYAYLLFHSSLAQPENTSGRVVLGIDVGSRSMGLCCLCDVL